MTGRSRGGGLLAGVGVEVDHQKVWDGNVSACRYKQLKNYDAVQHVLYFSIFQLSRNPVSNFATVRLNWNCTEAGPVSATRCRRSIAAPALIQGNIFYFYLFFWQFAKHFTPLSNLRFAKFKLILHKKIK